MIDDPDLVALTRDLPAHGLRPATWHRGAPLSGRPGFEVEFVSGAGATLAVLTLEHPDVRPLGRHDAFHVRNLVGTTG